MKNLSICLFILGILMSFSCPLLAGGYTIQIGQSYQSADDYYQTISAAPKYALYGANGSDDSSQPGHQGDPGSSGSEDDDYSKPGSQSDPGIPVGALPFAFLALLAGGYGILKWNKE